jgi:lysine 2,3-aminomutase
MPSHSSSGWGDGALVEACDEEAGSQTLSRIQRDVLGVSPRGPWGDVSEEQWNDWRWQQRNRVQRADQLERVVQLTDEEREAIRETSGKFRMSITPYYAALMDPSDPHCPVRKQAVPALDELLVSSVDLADPLGEESYMPIPGITHRYPDRVLFYVTHNCPVYCRHCTRKRKVSDPTSAAANSQMEAGLAYIRSHPEVRDVLVSGGDPLSLSDNKLERLVRELRAIPHVEIIRLCTRNPVTLPSRITDELVDRLRPYQPIFVHTHFNHPRECTPEAALALRRMADAGFTVANQMVLLAGVNDTLAAVKETNHWLLRQRCRPYYLFQADLAEGIGHFRTPIETGLKIIQGLRGFTSGMAVPHFVIDAPGGGGKVPMTPDYGFEFKEDVLSFENYQGKTFSYPLR